MHNKPYLLFDLDGTITDSQLGITRSAAYALEQFNIHIEDPASLRFFVGPPLHDTFMEHYGFTSEEAVDVVAAYRDYYRKKGIFENEVYPGIPELLKELNESGRTVILATSKPAVFARQILEYFSLDQYISYLSGAELSGVRNNKDEVIEYAFELSGITDRSQCVMIGDRKHDILGAKKTGIESIGVLYGYGDREELEKAGADVIADSVEDLRRILLK